MGAFTINRRSKYDPPSLLEQLLTSPLVLLISLIHNLLLLFRGPPISPPKTTSTSKPPIKIVCISDTHSHQIPISAIPPGDLLIHAGDLTNSGSKADIQKALSWLSTLPHRHKLVVAGNHDNYLDPSSPSRIQELQSGLSTYGGKLDWGTITYLSGTSTTLNFKGGRQLTIFGAPGIPYIGNNHAFQYSADEAGTYWEGKVPMGIDVLVTHTPPRAHMDLGLGCEGLLREVWRVRPKVCVFGHIHSGYGMEGVWWDGAQSAMERLRMGSNGVVRDFTDSARWIDAGRVLWGGVRGILWRFLMDGGRSGSRGSLMVNAALTYQSTSRIGNKPTVIEL